MLVLEWSQRAYLGRPKGHIKAPKGYSALWKRPSKNPDLFMNASIGLVGWLVGLLVIEVLLLPKIKLWTLI